MSSVRSFRSTSKPVSITYSSSTQDERRSNTNDGRYLTTSVQDHTKLPSTSAHNQMRSKRGDLRYYQWSFETPDLVPPKSVSSYTKNDDKRYYSQPCAPRYLEEQSLPAFPPSSMSSDEVATYGRGQIDAAEDEPTTEGSSQSIDSDESGSVSLADDEKLTIAYTKHQIILSLMRDVYAMFSSQWQANVRTLTTPEAECSRALLDSCESADSPPQIRLGKRANYERDRSPGYGNDGKKRRNNPPGTINCEPDLQPACPFHKYDPSKYCPNIDTGVKYRTCLGPGFPSISRLK